MVNKAKLDNWLAKPRQYAEEIDSALYTIAQMVAAKTLGAEPEDLAQSVWLHLRKCVGKCDLSKGSGFSFFYRLAQRESWRLAGDESKARMLPIEGEGKGKPLSDLIQPAKAKPTKKADELPHTLRLLDRAIRNAQSQRSTVEDESSTAHYLQGGIECLQQFRVSLVGSRYVRGQK